ncbi:MAG: carboxypeptidase-like regulatory domain-containing protein [Promethearchaeota archaeon]
MRRLLVPLVIFIFILSVPITNDFDYTRISNDTGFNPMMNEHNIDAANGMGNDLTTVAFFSRVVSGQQLGIYNSYSDITHKGILDFSGYQVPGWTLYRADVDAASIIAAPERETLGVSANTYNYILNNSGVVTDALYQEFYGLSHDGKLENYSITYKCSYYTSSLGDAYLGVRSNYDDPQTNVTGWITPFSIQIADTDLTHDVSADNAILNASTSYYVVIDGTSMIGLDLSGWKFNTIWWSAQFPLLGLDTAQHIRGDTWYSYIGGDPREAVLNYTYTPWNKTSNSALAYTSAEQLSLAGNATSLTGTSWMFNSTSNLTQIQFQTNQSVNVDYDLTLWYKRSETASTAWFGDSIGSDIEWNATTSVSYPVLSGTLEKYINYSVPVDWIPSSLYNGTTPILGTYTKIGTVVQCTSMTDGVWTLSSTAPNYVTALDLSDSSDGSPVVGKVNNSVDVDIDATIEDGDANPITGGIANLTVLQSGSQVYAPAESTATGGLSSFTWDISATTTGNGTHSVEVFWVNGTEAGYLVVDVFVYYAATLAADNMTITAYTDNSFNIGINFDQIFPSRGLDGALASVMYDFGSGNTSLNDDGGGRWSATISTALMTDGVYSLYVYAEGYALENNSLTITVNLVHETQLLNWSWSNTDNITYTSSTNLSISYMMLDNTRIDAALVNVTVEGVPYDMIWDPVLESYWIELTGENFSGIGTFTLSVSAWKAGYEWQVQEINITIRSETTGLFFDVEYSPLSRNISYIDSLFIQVTYDFNLNPIDSNTLVRITFNGSAPLDLVFNPISSKWETTLQGDAYFVTGPITTWNIMINATASGYTTQTNTTMFTVYENTPILTSSWSGNSSATDYATLAPLTITLTDSIGAPITDATVSFTAFGTPYSLSTGAGGLYTFNIDPTETRGVESFVVSVVRTGFVSSQITLNLKVEATTSLEFTSLLSSEYEQWNLTIEAIYLDTFYSTPIGNATVTVTLDGVDYTLQYSAGVYATEIILDVNPGEYTIYVSASAEFAVSATNQAGFTVIPKEHVYLEISYDGNLIAGQFMEVIATLRSNNTGNPPIPGEVIRFVVSVYFDNGTEVQYSGPEMTDSTNADGVASVGFEVPFGNVDRLTAHAFYDGSRTRWATDLTENAGVDVDPLSLLLAFFMSGVGLTAVLIIALVGIVAAGYNRGIKPKKRVARRGLENQLQMFRDLETIQHFMAVYLDRGTCVFYHPFTEERIQPDLISGFIAAITSVYGEIKGDGVRGTLEEIQYHGLRLNSYSGQYIIGILILGGEMTPLLRERLQFFVELFENQYEKDLDGWTGVVDCFDPEWVVSTLNSAFNYAWHLPHRFGPTQKVTKNDAKMLDYIGAVRDERGEFYIKDLLIPLSEMLDKTPAQVLDRLLYLQDKGVILPIGIQTILQRQGLALVDGAEIPAGLIPEDLEYEPLEKEEKVDEQKEEPPKEPEQEVDEMEAFVQDVESILRKEAEKEKEDPKKDDE